MTLPPALLVTADGASQSVAPRGVQPKVPPLGVSNNSLDDSSRSLRPEVSFAATPRSFLPVVVPVALVGSSGSYSGESPAALNISAAATSQLAIPTSASSQRVSVMEGSVPSIFIGVPLWGAVSTVGPSAAAPSSAAAGGGGGGGSGDASQKRDSSSFSARDGVLSMQSLPRSSALSLHSAAAASVVNEMQSIPLQTRESVAPHGEPAQVPPLVDGELVSRLTPRSAQRACIERWGGKEAFMRAVRELYEGTTPARF